MASKSGIEAGRAFIRMFLMDDQMRAQLSAMQSRLKALSAKVANIGAQMTAIGTAMTVPFAAALAMFVPFSDAMLTAKSAIDITGVSFDELTNKAKALGTSSAFTATQVAQMMTELGRAGFDSSQVDAMIESVLNLSRASGTEAAMAAGIMSATIRQFSLDATDATRVSDVLTHAANATFNSVESLGEALKYAGPVAAELGMSLEDTVAILGTLGDVGIQGSEAGTSLRRLAILVGAEAKKMEQVFGVAALDAAGNTRPLVTVLGEVAAATAHLSSGEKLKKFNDAFGILGITAANVLSRMSGETAAMADQLEHASGVAAATAATMDSGLGGSFKRFMGAVEGVALAVSEALEGPLKTYTGWAIQIIEWITSVVKHHELMVQVFAHIGPVVAVMGTAFLAFAAAVKIVSFVVAAWTVVTKAAAVGQALLLALANPAALLAGAALAAGAIYGIAKGFEEYQNAAGDAMAESELAAKSLGDVKGQLDALGKSPKPDLTPAGTAQLVQADEAVKKLIVSMAGLRGATAAVLAEQSAGDALTALSLLGGDAAADAADRLRAMVETAIPPSEQLRRKLLELDATMAAFGDNVPPDLRAKLQLQIVEDATGALGSIRTLQDEIAILAGVTTAAGQDLQALAEAGTPPQLLEQYRQLRAERDRLKEISESDKKSKSEAEDKLKELQQQAESVKTANQTGREKIAVQLEQLKTLRATLDPNTNTPLLDEETYSRALRKLHAEQRALAGEDASRLRSPTINASQDIRGAEGAKFLVDLFNGRQGIEQQVLAATMFANRQRAEQLALMGKQNAVGKATVRG